jgi:type IV secretory pathway VirD2 relaxase
MVKVTGRTRDAGHLRAHLDYISRNGDLEMEDRDGALVSGRAAVRELADDWSAFALSDRRRRETTPFSHSVMLSMPAGTDPLAVRDAARAFAQDVFGDRFDYVFALHTDAPHPHVHLSIRSLGDNGKRLNPKKADLETWRQAFAEALRDRGVEAEATPRRARGVTRKAERGSLRRMRQRYESGSGPMPRNLKAAYQEAAQTAVRGRGDPAPWESKIATRQSRIRSTWQLQSRLLAVSPKEEHRTLSEATDAYLSSMPNPDTQLLALARELRVAGRGAPRDMGKPIERSR